jgi:uncharacterized cupredoxin-like copper-binding protein
VLHLVAGLSTSHKIGLAVVGAVFIVFALSASFLAPRRWPDFPGRNGMGPFVIACVVIFAGMLSAVYFFGKEPAEAKAGGAASSPGAQGAAGGRVIAVTESEFKIQVPAASGLKAGNYTFKVHNAGKIPHDVVVTGPGVPANDKTPMIPAGGDATLKVTLATGSYTLYCSVPGHKALGMVAKLTVG